MKVINAWKKKSFFLPFYMQNLKVESDPDERNNGGEEEEEEVPEIFASQALTLEECLCLNQLREERVDRVKSQWNPKRLSGNVTKILEVKISSLEIEEKYFDFSEWKKTHRRLYL